MDLLAGREPSRRDDASEQGDAQRDARDGRREQASDGGRDSEGSNDLHAGEECRTHASAASAPPERARFLPTIHAMKSWTDPLGVTLLEKPFSAHELLGAVRGALAMPRR